MCGVVWVVLILASLCGSVDFVLRECVGKFYPQSHSGCVVEINSIYVNMLCHLLLLTTLVTRHYAFRFGRLVAKKELETIYIQLHLKSVMV